MLVLGSVCFKFAQGLWVFYMSALLFGAGYGGLVALESPVVAELFGLKSHGAILGIVFFSATMGGACGPFVAGRMFDATGSYQVAFLIINIIAVAGLILATLVRPPRRSSLV